MRAGQNTGAFISQTSQYGATTGGGKGLIFNASNYDAIYSGNGLQLSALQCLICIKL